MSLVLYHYWRSSCSWRVRWALAHKGLKYEAKPVNLLQNEQRDSAFLKLNPAGTVPCLITGGRVLTESLAILEWLEERYPQKPLLPQDPDARFLARQLALTIVAGTQPIQNLKVLRYISNDQDERNRFAKHWITEGLHQFESLVQNYAGTYCLGGSLSIADLCLIPQVYNAKRFNVDMTLFPRAVGIYERCMALPACLMSSPEMQTDATK